MGRLTCMIPDDPIGAAEALRVATTQQLERIDVDPAGDPLDRLQGQVALAALDTAHVGAVDADKIGEGFLA